LTKRSRLEITALGVDVLRRNARHQEAWLGQAIAKNLRFTERGLLRLALELLDRISGSDSCARRQRTARSFQFAARICSTAPIRQPMPL